MPTIEKKSICIVCRKSFVGTGDYCPEHKPKRKPDTRANSGKRGYGTTWRKIRAKVLSDWGIPKERWHLYDVDHNPAYNAEIEPDHTKYNLIPRLHADHSRKTAEKDVKRDKNGRFLAKNGHNMGRGDENL